MPVFVNNLLINQKSDRKLPDVLEKVVQTALKVEGRNDDPEVSIVLVDDEYIRGLNRTYRNKDSATDVLSFAMEETGEDEPADGWDEENILGDIIISIETAQRQAEEFGHTLIREMAFLTAHGMFHLLGYDHENEEDRSIMREKEEQVLSILEIGR